MWSRGSDDNRSGQLLWAVALALGGIILLLFNLNFFATYEPLVQYILSGLLAIAGLIFFGSYVWQRGNWWRLIPGWTLLALAGMVYLTTVDALDQRVTASLLFVGQALAFAHIYLLDRKDRWWAVIPGGFMLVLGGVIALSSRTEDPDMLGTVLFVGMGTVFLLLYLLGMRRRLWWSLIPGAVLVIFGLFLFSVERSQQSVLLRWWPLLLIVLGALLAWRAFRRRQAAPLSVESASNLSRHNTPKQAGRDQVRSGPRQLGDYAGPAPGASAEILSDPEEKQ